MKNRRQFLGAMGKTSTAAAVIPMLNPSGVRSAMAAMADYTGTTEEIAGDESFWFE